MTNLSTESATSARETSPEKTLRIQLLSPEVISQIHSSKHITSLQGVILSLLENSLDAEATRIEVLVDWKRGGCTVDDNGIGIPSNEFAGNGGLGRMYCTSKRAPAGIQPAGRQFHGSTGTFLAHLAAMSLLHITSHHKAQGSAALTLHHGKVVDRRLPIGGSLATDSVSQRGTNVSVRDLFGNMPVRIKQRSPDSEEEKPWQDLKRGIVALLLAWPKPCAVRLRDENIESRVVHVSGLHPNISSTLTKKSLNQLAGMASKFDLRDTLPILFQSGLASPRSRLRWVPLSASTAAVSLKGLICLDPAPTKQCQFVALGIKPFNPETGQSQLNEAVNKIFSNSRFGLLDEETEVSYEASSEGKITTRTIQQAQTRKAVDRYPMYCLQLQLKHASPSTIDVERLNNASLKSVMDLLEAGVTAWLEVHHFRPRKMRKKRGTNKDSSAANFPASSWPSAAILDGEANSDGFLESESGRSQRSELAGWHKRQKVAVISKESLASGTGVASSRLGDRALDLSALTKIRTGNAGRAGFDQRDRPSSGGSPGFTREHENHTLVSRGPKPRTIEVGEYSRPPADTSSVPRPEVIDMCSPVFESRPPLIQPPLQDTPPFSEDFGSIEDAAILAAVQGAGPDFTGKEVDIEVEPDDVVTWTEPVSKQVFRVNSRTGVVLPVETSRQGSDDVRQRAGIDTRVSSAGKPLSLSRRSALAAKGQTPTSTVDNPKWLPGFLREWNNPVFATRDEEPIAVASINGPGFPATDDEGKCSSHETASQRFASHSGNPTTGLQLSKIALQQATVIDQVDKKFILCTMPKTTTSPTSTSKDDQILVLVDQHAASERILLERLLSALRDPKSGNIQRTQLATHTTRAKPLIFEISPREHELFAAHQTHFSLWGITYTLPSPPPDHDHDHHRIQVQTLPTLIAERCANTPALCIDLLRSEIWQLADRAKRPLTSFPNTSSSSSSSTSEDEVSWLAILPLLPTGLRDMLHSRACRSAVMFNDALTREECEALMRDVGRCVFPFVCAHGRVGMVPLVDLGHGDGGGGLRRRTEVDGRGAVDVEERCDEEALGRWMMKVDA